MSSIILDNKIIFVVLFILLSIMLYVLIYTVKRNDRIRVEKRALENQRTKERSATETSPKTIDSNEKMDVDAKIETNNDDDDALIHDVMKEAAEWNDTDYSLMTEQELRECYRKLRISLGAIDYLIKAGKLNVDIGQQHRERMMTVIALIKERMEAENK